MLGSIILKVCPFFLGVGWQCLELDRSIRLGAEYWGAGGAGASKDSQPGPRLNKIQSKDE